MNHYNNFIGSHNSSLSHRYPNHTIPSSSSPVIPDNMGSTLNSTNEIPLDNGESYLLQDKKRTNSNTTLLATRKHQQSKVFSSPGESLSKATANLSIQNTIINENYFKLQVPLGGHDAMIPTLEIPRFRDRKTAPICKLGPDLVQTYLKINEVGSSLKSMRSCQNFIDFLEIIKVHFF